MMPQRVMGDSLSKLFKNIRHWTTENPAVCRLRMDRHERGHRLTALVLLVLLSLGLQESYPGETNEHIVSLEALLSDHIRRPQLLGGFESRPDFPQVLSRWANQNLKTPEEAQRELDRWIEVARHTSTNTTERARAAFLARQFTEAARLFEEAAIDRQAQSNTIEAVENLLRAGEALTAANHLPDALQRFERASQLLVQQTNSVAWAEVQSWLGLLHGELVMRNHDTNAPGHLRAAISACREALKVYTCEQFPQKWANTQHGLGNALTIQGLRSEGTNAAGLHAEGVAAYQEALKVYIREQFSQNWAVIQHNLGTTLSHQAIQGDAAKAVGLLTEAAAAYCEALKVYTREAYPQDWARLHECLGLVLTFQGTRSTNLAVPLLEEAAAALRKALQVYTREQFPYEWARVQNDLGGTLSEEALREKVVGNVEPLFGQAVAAHREAITVFTRERFPDEWARAQHDLGIASYRHAARLRSPRAMPLLNEAETALHGAMEVWTKEMSPENHALAAKNLELVQKGLRRVQRIQGTHTFRGWKRFLAVSALLLILSAPLLHWYCRPETSDSYV